MKLFIYIPIRAVVMGLEGHWDTVVGVLGHLDEHISVLFLSKCFFYVTLLLHIVHYQRYLPEHLKTNHLLGKSFKYVLWAHGLSVFAMLKWFQTLATRRPDLTPPAAAAEGDVVVAAEHLSVVHYLALSALVVVLWDLGVVGFTAWKVLIPINLHHVAVFIVLAYQPYETATGAWYNAALFSWIWAIHAFGIINELILPLFGIHVKPGERLGALDFLRHVYATGTVYFFHRFIMADGQPGLGWNYQTLSIVCMLGGRYAANGNWRNNPFMRRVEIPGVFAVLFTYFIFSEDNYCERSFGVLVAMFLGYITYKVFFTVLIAKPARYLGPFSEDSDASVTHLIESFRKDLEKEYPNGIGNNEDAGYFKSPAFVSKWFDGQQNGEWIEKYPLFRAIVVADEAEVEKLLHEKIASGDRTVVWNFVNESMKDWQDTNPLGWAINLERWSIIRLLVANGADPYRDFHEGTSLIQQFFTAHRGSKKRENLLFMKFFEELHVLCLKVSPSAEPAWSDLSVSERVLRTIKDL